VSKAYRCPWCGGAYDRPEVLRLHIVLGCGGVGAR
jgi:hypothetical protein